LGLFQFQNNYFEGIAKNNFKRDSFQEFREKCVFEVFSFFFFGGISFEGFG